MPLQMLTLVQLKKLGRCDAAAAFYSRRVCSVRQSRRGTWCAMLLIEERAAAAHHAVSPTPASLARAKHAGVAGCQCRRCMHCLMHWVS